MLAFGSTPRSFKYSWFKDHPWLEWDSEVNKAFCHSCRMAEKLKLFSFWLTIYGIKKPNCIAIIMKNKKTWPNWKAIDLIKNKMAKNKNCFFKLESVKMFMCSNQVTTSQTQQQSFGFNSKYVQMSYIASQLVLINYKLYALCTQRHLICHSLQKVQKTIKK